MPISPEFTSVHERSFEIEFTQCFPNGLLRYTDLCDILQLTAGAHADLGGISFSDMQAFHQAWVLGRMRIEIDRMPRWRENVTVRTWIVSLENSRSVRALEVLADGKRIVGCETFWAVFNTKTRRPEALALEHGHFEKFGERFSTKERVKRIGIPETRELVLEHKAALSDLDIVNHVNNVKYLEWCFDAENPEVVLSGKIASLDLNFMSELRAGDAVSIFRAETGDAHVFTIEKDGKPSFALEAGFS